MLPFTRDLDGYEVEIKLSANCTDPTLFVLDLSDEFDRGVYPGWLVQRNLGVRETAITTWRLNIQAWGVKNSESLIQKIMVAERADGMKNLSQKETVYPLLVQDPVLIRPEDKSKSYWMESDDFSKVWKEMMALYPGLTYFGSYLRTKTMFFVVSGSRRNYCIAADYSVSEGKKLFQVEVEYKGREGIHKPAGAEPLVEEMNALARMLEIRLGLRITTLTKLEWLLS